MIQARGFRDPALPPRPPVPVAPAAEQTRIVAEVERRLSVVSPDAYGITVTRVDYLRHAFIDNGGPNGTAKRTTEYFYFCSGKLYVPPEQYATMDGNYAKAGAEAQKAMLMDKDVAELTKALKR